MLKDNIKNIDRFIFLDPLLDGFRRDEMHEALPPESFICDRDNTTLFLVEKGRCSFALGWRENENNREVLAVMNALENEFVLYLPGEPYTFRSDDGAIVKVWGKV